MMKKVILTNIILLQLNIACLFGVTISSCAPKNPGTTEMCDSDTVDIEKKYREMLYNICLEVNDSLPKSIEEGIILKKCKLQGMSMQYTIEVANYTKEEMKAARDAIYANMLEDLVVKFDINRSELEAMRYCGYDISVRYVDSNGKQMLKINIPPKEILSELEEDI